ncbi:MAG: hypothetical protein ACOYEH_05405 [Caldicoprobacterales bacterium]|jgi:hypothetical protein|nr:hypothetical protein [Clostridiales bacterium]
MTRKYPGKKPVFLICIIFALFITGCNMLRPTAPKEESEKKKNPPKALTQMEKETDGIIQDLEEVQEKRAKQLREIENPSKERPPEQPQGQQQKQQQDQSQQQQGQEGQEKQQEEQGGQQQDQGQQQGRQQEGQQKQAQQPQQTPQPIPEPDWNKLESIAKTLNEQWNNFEPAAKSDGAMNETIKGFEEQLIALTEQIMARNEEKTLMAAISLYSYFPDFLKLYAHNQPPEIKELRGLTRQIIMYGQQDKWQETRPLLDKMKKAWQEAKTKMKKNDKMLNSKIDAALSDFQFVVTEKKINMAKIKGSILIKNLDQVE